MGMSPASSASTFAASESTHATVLPFSARHAPTTRPTYPVPTTPIFRFPPLLERQYAEARQSSRRTAGHDPITLTRMSFGLDLRPSLARPTAVGTYVLALAQRLPLLAPQDRCFLFSASFRNRYPDR